MRYLVGKDVEGWVQAKSGMSEAEFFKVMKQNLLGST